VPLADAGGPLFLVGSVPWPLVTIAPTGFREDDNMAPQARQIGTAVKRALGSLVAIALLASTATVFVGDASATTAPGSIYQVRVNITDSDVLLVPHKQTGRVKTRYISADGRSAQFPRGVYLHFVFWNKGTRTYLPAIRLTDTRNANPYAKTRTLYKANKVKPGGHVSLYGNFYFRGAFEIAKLVDQKTLGRPVHVTIY